IYVQPLKSDKPRRFNAFGFRSDENGRIEIEATLADSTAPSGSPTFNDRYGDWGSSPVPPRYPPPPSQSPGPAQTDPNDFRILRPFTRAPAGSLAPAPLGVPNQPQTQPQSDRPLGLFSGQPMPNYPVPPPIFDFPDRSTTSSDNDLFARWIKPLLEQ